MSPIYLDTEEKINTINRMIDLAVQQNMKILVKSGVQGEYRERWDFGKKRSD